MSKMDVINALVNLNTTTFTIDDIVKATNMPYINVYQVIRRLKVYGYIKVYSTGAKRKGKGYTYEITSEGKRYFNYKLGRLAFT